MRNYHVKCEKCGQVSSVYSKSIFEAYEDHEQNHICDPHGIGVIQDEFESIMNFRRNILKTGDVEKYIESTSLYCERKA